MGKSIQKILKEWKKEAKVDKVIQFIYREGILTIYTSQPGFMIGRAGIIYNKFIEIFKNEILGFESIEFMEVDRHWV